MSDLTWFNEARYGMFIHWGAYSVAARGEWLMNRERVPKEEYIRKYVDNFTAAKYDPREWAQLAVDAGMKYVVLTTRHHDGFALWDTATSDFNAAKLGPGRDLLAPFADAVREAGLKLGFYYSGADWRHPDYPGAFARDWPGEEDWASEEARQRFIEYYRAQIRELLTNYGKVDILWYDGCVPSNLDGEETNREIKKLQPHILINQRNGEPYDFENCEQAIKPAAEGVSWEACMTLNNSWGYHAGDRDWKAPAQVLEMLITCAKGGGNLLLNIGPREDGSVPEESVRILREAGEWIRRNEAFLRDSDRSPFGWFTSGLATTRGHRVYLHIFKHPGREFCWAELKNEIRAVRFLATGEAVPFQRDGVRLIMTLPDVLPDAPVTTIEIETDGTPEPATEQTTFWIPGD